MFNSLLASTILKITYGITPKPKNDPLVELAEIALAGVSEAGNPGSFLVDLIPAMKYIPDWFPGTEWKKKAAYWTSINERMVNDPWGLITNQTVSNNFCGPIFGCLFLSLFCHQKEGTAPPSVAASMICNLPDEASPDRAEADEVARNVCAVAFAGKRSYPYDDESTPELTKLLLGGADTVRKNSFASHISFH